VDAGQAPLGGYSTRNGICQLNEKPETVESSFRLLVGLHAGSKLYWEMQFQYSHCESYRATPRAEIVPKTVEQ
jgi:hypothetical protein